MQKYKIFKKNEMLSLHILIFSIIYFGRDTLITTTLLGFLNSQIILTLILLFYLFFFVKNNFGNLKLIIQDVRIKACLIICMYIMISMVINNAYTLMYISIIYAIVISLFLSLIVDYKKFMLILSNCILILGLYSLICVYIIKPLCVYGLINLPVFENSSNLQFYNMVFSFPVSTNTYIRNFSIFREPGVFQFFITISLISELFILNRKRFYIYALLHTLFMISTFSTSGMVQMVIIYLAYFIKKIINMMRNRNMIVVLFLIFALVFILYHVIVSNPNIYWTVRPMIEKLIYLNINDPRIEAIVGNIKMIVNSPIFGDDINKVLGSVSHNTSSTLLLTATFGIQFGLLHTFSWFLSVCEVKLNESKQKRVIIYILLGIALFCSFNTQNLTTNAIFWSCSFIVFFEWLYKKDIEYRQKELKLHV